jgi:hypothetical protein
MITKVKVELLPLTLELAKKINGMRPLPGERDLKASDVRRFETHLKAGTWTSPSWAVARVKETDEVYRADGQHTSHALLNALPELFPVEGNVTITHYDIDSIKDDAAALFEEFDSPLSARSNKDVMGIYRARYKELEDQKVDKDFLVKVTNGIDFYLRDQRGELLQSVIRYTVRKHGLYLDDPEFRSFVMWLYRWHGTKYAWMIGKPGIIAEILTDWKTDAKIATEFWDFAFRESHPDVTNVTRKLTTKFNDWRRDTKKKPQDRYRKEARDGWQKYLKIAELSTGPAASDAPPPKAPPVTDQDSGTRPPEEKG